MGYFRLGLNTILKEMIGDEKIKEDSDSDGEGFVKNEVDANASDPQADNFNCTASTSIVI